MIKVNRPSLGFTYPVRWYENADEADLDGGKGACVQECNLNLTYRGTNPEGRAIICEVLSRATGIPRKERDVLDKEGKPVKDDQGVIQTEWDEKEQEYVNRVMAMEGMAARKGEFQALIDEACNRENDGQGLRVDIREKAREAAKPRKLSEEYLQMSRKLLADEAQMTRFKKAYAKLFAKPMPDLPTDTLRQPETLGWLVRDFWLEDAKQRKEQLKF